MPATVLQMFPEKKTGVNAIAEVNKPVYIPPPDRWVGGMAVLIVECIQDSYAVVSRGYAVDPKFVGDASNPSLIVTSSEVVMPGLPYFQRITDTTNLRPYELTVTCVPSSDSYGSVRPIPDVDAE